MIEENIGMCRVELTYDEEQLKIQMVIRQPLLRTAILAAVRAIEGRVTSGVAPPSAMDDQLEDWLEVLMA